MRGAPCPKISVVMAVRDGEPWLAEAVRSLLTQSEPSLEIIAVDDGSADRTLSLLEALAKCDGRVRVVRQARRGLTCALNAGLAKARAPLVARLDADDVAHPRRLELQAAFLEANPRVGLVGSWTLEIDEGGRPLGLRTPPADDGALRKLLARTNPFVHSSIMARTALLRQLGGYRPAFEMAEDYDLWLRVSEASDVANLEQPLVSYRLHGENLSRRFSLRQAFSVRLAQRSAAARRACEPDPADHLTGPPDWRGPPAGAFYAEDAELYRWLDTAPNATGLSAGMAPRLIDRLAELNHAERRLAARALWARMRSEDRRESLNARGLLLKLCRVRPRTVLRAAWSLRELRPAGQPGRLALRPSLYHGETS
jgi:glycosyltransferase involved in cell wall biosynthesis